MPSSASFFSTVPAIVVLLRRQLGAQKRGTSPCARSSAKRPMKMPSCFADQGPLASAASGCRCGRRRALFCRPGDTRRFAHDIVRRARPSAGWPPLRWRLLALPAPAHRRRARPIALASHRAVYDLKLSTTARQARDERGARPHPLRFLRQRLRRLCAAIPPGVRARQRRGQGRSSRDLRATSWEDGAANGCGSIRRTTSTTACATRSTARPSASGDGVAVELTQAGREEARSEERSGVSDRARPPHHRRGPRGQDAAARSRSMTAPTPARRSTTR